MYLPQNVRKKLAFALLMSNISYCIEVVSGVSRDNFNKIQRLFNMVVRFVFGLKRFDHVSAHAVQFLGVPFELYVNQRLLLVLYKTIRYDSPELLRANFVFSRSTRNTQLLLPRFSSSIFERSFAVRVIRIWNHLPNYLRTFSFTVHMFKNNYLQYALRQS